MDTNRRNRKISKTEDTSISINDIENENALENSLVETIQENASMEEPSSTVKDIEESASKDPQKLENLQTESDSVANI